MFVVSGGRRTGKTSFLIWKSAYTGIPILVTTHHQQRYIGAKMECDVNGI